MKGLLTFRTPKSNASQKLKTRGVKRDVGWPTLGFSEGGSFNVETLWPISPKFPKFPKFLISHWYDAHATRCSSITSLFLSGSKGFPHFITIDAAQIVALQSTFHDITVT